MAAFGVLSVGSIAARAADTWLGLDSTWDDPANWSGGQAPSPGGGTLDQATFPNYSTSLSQPSVSGTETFGTLSFSSGSWSIAGTGTLAIDQINSTGAVTLSPNLNLAAGASFSAGGGSLTLNGSITSSGPINLAGNSAAFILNGSNSSLTGGLLLSGTGQTITAGSATALGSGSISIPNATTTTFNDASGSVVSCGGLNFTSGGTNALTITSTGAAGFSFGSLALASSGTLAITGPSGMDVGITGMTMCSGSGTFTLQSNAADLLLGPLSGSSTNCLINLSGNAKANLVQGSISNGTAGGDVVGIVKSNASIWTLTGSNSYSGGTSVQAGTLIVSDATAYGPGNAAITSSGLGTGSLSVSSGAQLILLANGQPDATAQILAYANAGTFQAPLNQTTSIAVDRQGGSGTNKTIELGALYLSGTVGIGTLNVTSGDGYGLAFSSLTIATTGTLAISGTASANLSINGTTTLPASGTLTLQSNTANITLGAVTATSQNSGELDLDGSTSANVIAGPISDGGSAPADAAQIVKTNSSTWTLAGSNSYSGGTIVKAGTLIVADTTNYGPGNATITSSGLGSGTVSVSPGALLSLRANGQPDATSQILSYATAGTFQVLVNQTQSVSVDREGGSGTDKTIELGGLYLNGSSGTGTLNVASADGYGLGFASLAASGTGTLAIAGTSGASFLVGGTTTLPASGTLMLQSSTANITLGSVSTPITDHAVLDLDGTTSGNVISGYISNNTSIQKTNSSTWTLIGASNFVSSSTYTGGTNIQGGTLIVSDATAYGPGNGEITNSGLGTGSINVGAGATLALKANGQPDTSAQMLTYENAGVFEAPTNQTENISVDRQGGPGTNKTIQLGTLSLNGSTGTGTLNISSGDGYGLAFASLNVANTATLAIAGTSGANFSITGTADLPALGTLTVASSTANITLGAVMPLTTRSAQFDLDGTTTGNVVTGTISDGPEPGNTVSLTKSNSGTWMLIGTNTYSGQTTITSGTLVIGNGNISGTLGSGSIANDGYLVFNLANSTTYDNPITGTGTLVQNGSGTTILSGNVTAQGEIVNAGTLIVQTGSIPYLTNNATVTITQSAATTVDGIGSLILASSANLTATHIRQNGLTIGSGSTVTITDNGSGPGTSAATSIVTNLYDNGTLDLNNNDLIVGYSAQFAMVQAAITSAFDGGKWDRPGITSSSARANTGSYALGYATAAEAGVSTFDGQNVSAGETLVKYTLLGDTALRGTVGIGDYDAVLSNFGQPQDWSGGDFHYGGVVGIGDYDDVLSNYGAHASGNLTPGPSLASSAMIKPNLAKTDLKLEVNTTTGDVYVLATASAAFTGYTISDPLAHLLGGSTSPDPDKLLSVSAGNGGNTNVYETSGTYVDWFKITETASQVAEGQQQNGFGTHSSRDDTINIPAGGTIDFGEIFNTAAQQQDLTFDFAEAGTEPTNGPTYYGAEVDYVSAPEPAAVSLLTISAVGALARRRRRRACRTP